MQNRRFDAANAAFGRAADGVFRSFSEDCDKANRTPARAPNIDTGAESGRLCSPSPGFALALMKLFGLLRKPDWENKDAAVRLRAVQSSHAEALLALLPELSQRDPDADVRIAALRRVDDLPLLARRLRGENEVRVASAARERLLDRLCVSDQPLNARLAALGEVLDVDLIAAVAERAPESALRRAALEKINRPGLLFDRCVQDPDPAIRRWLLTRIDSPDALQRLVEAARKRDKSLSRAARERLEAMQLAAGDPQALAQRALQLCDQLERLARELPADRDAQLAGIRSEWSDLQTRVASDMQRRVEGYLDSAELAYAGARGELPKAAPTPVEEPETAAASDPAEPTEPAVPDAELEQLIERLGTMQSADAASLRESEKQARERAAAAAGNPAVSAQMQRFAELATALKADLAAQRESEALQRREAQLALLDQLEQALKAGSLSAARAARAELPDKGLPGDLKRRLAAAEEGLEKLGRWQRWSGNKVRSRLCDEAEALHGSGLHPDAMATRVKELQAEWSRLDGIEGEAAPASDSGLARRFRALCHRAIAPARPYFEKRRELRSERSGQIETLLQEIDGLIEGSDIKALTALRRRVGEAMRELADVAPEKRAAQGRALRERLTTIDAALNAGREDAALAKRKLLAKLKRDLGGHIELEAALSLARQAQADWKRLPRAERELDEALWTELRGMIDPLFERQREAEGQSREREAEADAAARSVLEELDALAGADDERLAHAEAHLEALAARWRALPVAQPEHDPRASGGRSGRDSRGGRDSRDGRGGREERRPAPRRAHPQEGRFDAAMARVQAARERAATQRERRNMLAICAAGALLDRLAAASDSEARDALRDEFDSLDLPGDARSALQTRLGPDPSTDAAQQAESLAVRAELAAGVESPPEAIDIRRQEQRQRLAAKLGGEALPDPAVEIRAHLIALQSLGGLTAQQRDALQSRIMAAFEKVA